MLQWGGLTGRHAVALANPAGSRLLLSPLHHLPWVRLLQQADKLYQWLTPHL